MPRRRWRGFAVAFAVALLAACSETRFESPPGDNMQTCDARWKGLWTGDDLGSNDKATAFLVDEECRFNVLEQIEKGSPFKQTRVPLNYVHADGRDYIVVADSALKELVELKPPFGIDPVPEKSFFFARYEAHADRIDVAAVDDRSVARQIIDGKLDGTVARTANELHVFVRGDRARMLEILRSGAIFTAKPGLRLRRIKQSPADYEHSLIQAQRKTPP